MKATSDLYEKGEQKYGHLGARLYSWTSRVRRPTYGPVVRDILSERPGSVLDIGCGTGDVLLQLATLDPQVECYGIDPSPAMLRIAAKNATKAGSGQGALRDLTARIHLALGSSRFIPFEKRFDFVFSTYSFHDWNNREQSVPLILSKLREGGTFAVYEYERDSIPSIFKLLFGKYMLSHDEIESLDFDGAEKAVDVSNGLAAVKFKWFGASTVPCLSD